MTEATELIVVRPSVTGSPGNGNFAPIERILVDLAVEVEKLAVIGSGEFTEMACRVATAGRVSIGAIVRYAGRRNLGLEDVFAGDNQLMSNIRKKRH